MIMLMTKNPQRILVVSGFVETEDELKVNVSQKEIDKILKEYKKIKKNQRSTLFEIKKLDS